jgi:hypothetical protein
MRATLRDHGDQILAPLGALPDARPAESGRELFGTLAPSDAG